jgi:hypothetical protein
VAQILIYLTTAGSVLNFTCPVDCNKLDSVECFGAGGAGNGGGGGGGGAYSAIYNMAVLPQQIIPYFIGGGYGPGNNGQYTYFQNGSTCFAEGGYSPSSWSFSPASGGRASVGAGTTRYSGGNGGPIGGYWDGTNAMGGAGGGGAAGPYGNGGDGAVGRHQSERRVATPMPALADLVTPTQPTAVTAPSLEVVTDAAAVVAAAPETAATGLAQATTVDTAASTVAAVAAVVKVDMSTASAATVVKV